MKTLKFRVWNKVEKRWYENVDVVLTVDGRLIVMEGYGKWEYIQKENYEIVFFTGLKDKNDKEIYEGDIVRFEDVRDCELHRGKVFFERGAFRIKTERFTPCISEGFIDDMEIMWNIYEHPELAEAILKNGE